jgi:condensin complex subunit 1
MAEQAVNTIYLLGEQPDTLCNDLLKNFTNRVFSQQKPAQNEDFPAEDDTVQQSQFGSVAGSPSRNGSIPPASQSQNNNVADPGDAFSLSQLIFLVGHVAIKHIVYLELVERELKRRKDDAAKGWFFLFLVEPLGA